MFILYKSMAWACLFLSKGNQYLTENIIETISELRSKDGKDIWLVGGGELISMLLTADIIDEMQICYVPVILGKGILLFPEQPKESKWKITGNKVYESGIFEGGLSKTG